MNWNYGGVPLSEIVGDFIDTAGTFNDFEYVPSGSTSLNSFAESNPSQKQ